MRFLVDAQLPPALARWLVANGHTAEHVADRQMEAASDSEIWGYALQEAAAIITKDEDFVERKTLSDTGPAVIWIRLRTRGDGSFSLCSRACCRMFCRRWNAARP
jgi:predicted nuclease of predicted toxin-antitoxin system